MAVWVLNVIGEYSFFQFGHAKRPNHTLYVWIIILTAEMESIFLENESSSLKYRLRTSSIVASTRNLNKNTLNINTLFFSLEVTNFWKWLLDPWISLICVIWRVLFFSKLLTSFFSRWNVYFFHIVNIMYRNRKI